MTDNNAFMKAPSEEIYSKSTLG